MLQADYGPLVVGGIAVSEVVEGGYAAQHGHGLVAYDHAVGETVAGEAFGSTEVARAEDAAFGVDEHGLSVDYAGIVVGHDGVGIDTEGVGRVKAVAGVEEYQVVALGIGDGPVHGVVDSVVGA